MKYSSLKVAAAIFVSVGLVACGGGGSDGNTSGGNTAVAATDAEVVADLKSSNIDFIPANRPAGTWRWPGTPSQHVLVYVPTPTIGNATEQDYAAKVATSIAVLNTKLTGLLVLESTNSIPQSGNFIQISYGTSYVPPGSTDYASYCANVSTGPGLGNIILPDNQNGIASSPVYINLGNGHCNVTQDIVTHEFGHALGLSAHFNGFGTGDSTSSVYFDVLATLYGNPQSTTANNIVVKRAAN